ncbi:MULTISPECIES: type II toxin-antitoxin system RelE/ParE family toxin [unclassified Colwellia]|uniref:type II toxin-antitoxin system RelE/ParE family toxin n=1 Tax=unclassified Colwellia TaxID=196834 RepID=UPI0015F4D1C1|nr:MULTISPECIES: type II toxin-antitoxin system RelE/ParE family toxin [unclassified Colwellia]MBA6231365.1 type II toxin-antitoxin system RelE/ParE family toxin [Colwellia sp. MB02u-7]MBA6235172.1 type II toxin-antitoxin system RelE/ParE family toxin [Colwellia sp. MB02u-11]MBA6254402.1 type II toxin-antitoxin system RelE/ParE family toxin [Colwellia sp. MB3u-28]MBA6258624.1 type II toxin-antitoxin system RelE/ParE family toxin [Colwellia sp. MB3u-41]MBA6297871.1 type II toxin-antitoxin syste
MKIVWSPLALEKLEASAKFIALDKPSAADKWVNDIFDRIDLLGSQPELGREVPELLGSNYREVIFGSYRIIYKVENEIKILTLRNSRQLLSLDDIEL